MTVLRKSVLASVAFAASLVALTPESAVACLAYSNPPAEYVQPPTLVLTAVVVGRTDNAESRYVAEVEVLIRGEMASPFTIGAPDGCHLPMLDVGDRIALVGGPQKLDYSGLGEYGPGQFWDQSGPIWLLDSDGAVLPQQRNDASPQLGPTVNGVIPRDLADILRILGLPPDTAYERPQPSLPTLVGTTFLVTAALLAARRLGRVRTRRVWPDERIASRGRAQR